MEGISLRPRRIKTSGQYGIFMYNENSCEYERLELNLNENQEPSLENLRKFADEWSEAEKCNLYVCEYDDAGKILRVHFAFERDPEDDDEDYVPAEESEEDSEEESEYDSEEDAEQVSQETDEEIENTDGEDDAEASVCSEDMDVDE